MKTVTSFANTKVRQFDRTKAHQVSPCHVIRLHII